MSKSFRKERDLGSDDWDRGEYYDYETARRVKKANKRRREDKRSARQLPCERED